MADASIHGIEFVIRGNSNSASDAIAQLTSQLNRLKGALSSAKGTSAMTNGIKKVGEEAKKQSSHTNQFFSSILRIAKYRLIRGALKAITSAFQEGLKNAYMFSKGIGGDLAEALDTLKTKSMTMKNQMGAAFGGLITALTPIVVQIIKIINTLAAAITRLIAILGGKSYWLRAKENWTEWGEAASGAGGAAKEALRYLAPFDELNRLPDENSGGGGGGGSTPDFSSMFEQVSIEEGAGFLDTITEAFQNITRWFDTQPWQELGAKFWEKIKGLFSSREDADSVVSSFFEVLGTAFGSVLGFVWGFLSSVADDLFGNFKNNIIDYDGDNKIGVLDVLKGIWKTVSDIGEWLHTNIIDPIFRGIQKGFNDGPTENPISFKEFLNNIFSSAGEWLEDVIAKGKEIGNGILQGIADVFTNVVGWAKEHIFDPIVNGIKSIFGIHSPSTEMESVGDDVGQGLLNGIKNVFSNVSSWVQNNILSPIQNAITNGQELVANVKAKVSEWIDDAKDKVVSGFSAVVGYVQDKIPEAQKKISAVAEFIKRAPLTGVMKLGGDGTVFSAVANFVKRLPIAQGAMKLGEAGTIFPSVASFVKRNTNDTFKLGGSNTVFGSVANFLNRTVGASFSSVFGSIANFVSTQWDYYTYGGRNPALNVQANFTSGTWSGGSISVPATFYTNQVMAKGGVINHGIVSRIPQYASGTANAHGSLFLAGEAGAELVGHIGGRTEVLNRSQLAATMYAAVRSAIASTGFRVSGVSAMAASVPSESGNNEEAMYRAMLRALNDSDVGDRPIELDGNTIYQNMVNRNRANTRLTGVNAMA